MRSLHLVIGFLGAGTELDFLDLDVFLLLLGDAGFLGLLEPELAVIHDPADRWFAIGGDFHQIETRLFGQILGLPDGHDPGLLPVRVDNANLRRCYVLVAPRFFC